MRNSKLQDASCPGTPSQQESLWNGPLGTSLGTSPGMGPCNFVLFLSQQMKLMDTDYSFQEARSKLLNLGYQWNDSVSYQSGTMTASAFISSPGQRGHRQITQCDPRYNDLRGRHVTACPSEWPRTPSPLVILPCQTMKLGWATGAPYGIHLP